MRATAIAHPNIALAKYWGKRVFGHNLPAVPSLSVTLRGMATETTVELDPALGEDSLELNGEAAAEGPRRRVAGLLDRVREKAGINTFARVTSKNDFPTASGLASSASAFAALAVAASKAAGLALSPSELSNLARQTSVSSARSVLGGFVELERGERDQSFLAANSVAPVDHWDLAIVVAVTREGPKDVGSSEGMQHTATTSPYFPAWVESAPSTFAAIKEALLARDFDGLGKAAEHSALAMHAAAIAARPAVVYWTGATVEAINGVKRLRADGLPAYATIDAGPHVKVITRKAESETVAERMRAVPGVLRTIVTEPGGGARVVGTE
jgi:diphosphomevalonate decarboxylase